MSGLTEGGTIPTSWRERPGRYHKVKQTEYMSPSPSQNNLIIFSYSQISFSTLFCPWPFLFHPLNAYAVVVRGVSGCACKIITTHPEAGGTPWGSVGWHKNRQSFGNHHMLPSFLSLFSVLQFEPICHVFFHFGLHIFGSSLQNFL